MRFNKSELATLASNPYTHFEREGLLVITERQEGFFRRNDVNYPRWCKLRGNLLFYLKDHNQKSQPAGVLVLENCHPVIKNDEREFDGFAFILEFEGSPPQRIAANTAKDRLDWLKCIQLASNSYLNKQISSLEKKIASAMGNRIERGTPICEAASSSSSSAPQQHCQALATPISTNNSIQVAAKEDEEDLSEVPICESALSCDNLPNAEHGRLPNTRVVCSVLTPAADMLWRDFARTEIIEASVHPQFLCTIRFRHSAGFKPDTALRFTVYDVREKVSHTSVAIGYAEVALGVIQDATRFRIPLRAISGGDCGFITIASWAPDTATQQPPPRSTTQVFEQQNKKHRRSQSLPPKLGVKLFVPFQGSLQRVFANPYIHTYRLHSSFGGDISVHEALLESKLCFSIPQQLLSIWIQREKELLQEISGMGELGGEWRRRQMDLLDKHLKLLKDYSQAKQNLQQLTKEPGSYFKRSSIKTDESLEFIPVNLHLQRMWAQNDSVGCAGVLDIITVGAFTRHVAKGRNGGLIKLLQATKESPSKWESGSACKVQSANDAVQAIKQLRREIVELMSQLLLLAKLQNPKGMMPLCNEMVTKTRTLLHIWEPSLVEEAFAFVEQHRIIEEPENVLMPTSSPFRKITQQLSALELKSPELEDFATPVVAPPDLWPRMPTHARRSNLVRSSSLHLKPSPSATDISAIYTLHRTVKTYNEQLRCKDAESASSALESDAQATFQSLPITLNTDDNFNDAAMYSKELENSNLKLIDLDELPNEHQLMPDTIQSTAFGNNNNCVCTASFSNNNCTPDHQNINTGFLDTKIMSSSPSANYYRPTEEPEPLDLTQLNIEASVMCLVSKIKFLCGRCGSPAIRLRHPKSAIKRTGFKIAPAPDIVVNSHQSSDTDDLQEQQHFQQSAQLVNSGFGNGLNLDLTQPFAFDASTQEVTENKNDIDNVQLCNTKKGNKFTDGLNLSLTTDWASELRPSMRKLRHAMDGLLKTARLMHSVQRLQQDMARNSMNLEIMFRRDVCFSQALTALISALMAKFWGTEVTSNFVKILSDVGPLAYFEGLLSLYGGETDMWGDMCIAIEDLSAVNFMLVRSNSQCDGNESPQMVPTPRVTGSRQSLEVLLPVPEAVYAMLPPTKAAAFTFSVTPVFFNVGINEKATLAETLGMTREQHRSNWDNFVRLKQYHSRFRKLQLNIAQAQRKREPNSLSPEVLANLLQYMDDQLRANLAKNVKILHLAEDACRLMSGLRFTSCKSAKDRTGMAVTLEQCRVLVQDFNLPAKNVPNALNTIRSEGTRMDNVVKNIAKRKYAFNLPQVLSLPAMYRPPTGAYGKAET